MPNFEALGDVATGGLIARSIEPRAGEADDGHTHESQCLNCGAELVGPYCAECGQHAHVHRTLGAFWHDLLHGVLHFEGKVWDTLPLLGWRPGELTRRYIEGERAKFVSPIALFLFSVFLMFAVASFSAGIETPGSEVGRAQVAREISTEERKLAQMQQQRDAALRAGRETAALDRRIGEKQRELAIMRGFSEGRIRTAADLNVSEEVPAWVRKGVDKAAQNPELLLYKLKTNAYKFSWALIPISVPFLWLLFPFSRRFRLYDHTVFVTYSLCFMTLLMIAVLALGALNLAWIGSLALLIPPFHMYRQLRGTYGLSMPGALVRTALLVIFAVVALVLFGLALLAMGVLD